MASRVWAWAELAPEAWAVVEPSSRTSYGQLARLAGAYGLQLAQLGLPQGARVAVMVPVGAPLFALTFALLGLGLVPVLIDPGLGPRAFGACLAEADPAAFVGIPKAHLARALLGWLPGAKLPRVVVGGWWPGALRLAPTQPGDSAWRPLPRDAADPAAVLFTSGSTGPAKGVRYSHGTFQAQVRLLSSAFGLQPGEVDLATFPLFALFDAALGATAVLPRMDFARPGRANPREILNRVTRHRASRLFASPALLQRLVAHLDAHPKEAQALEGLREVLSAGAPVRPHLLASLVPHLPEACRVRTPYGATEALPVAVVDHRELLRDRALFEAGAGVLVGLPAPGVSVHILRLSDDPLPAWGPEDLLPPGQVGEIMVAGPVVSLGYLHRPEAEAQARSLGPDGRVWHRMGDLGHQDAQGRLWMLGRKAHRVRLATGEELYPLSVEAIFDACPFVKRTALVGVGPAGAQEPVLCFERARSSHRHLPELLAELAEGQPHTQCIRTFLEHPGFPVDVRHNAKIRREELAAWATERLGPGWRPPERGGAA